ncbi:MAG: ferric iron uptake transcriptional regulator [Proteobacteria bacterium]|nr:ferric iron uptake transcriptional regulator [Pseudomonadota bacterium]
MKKTELKNAGLKKTTPRMKILHFLEKSDPRHVSAEELYKKLLEAGDEVALATIYRVLTQFEKAGLVKRHNFEGGYSLFELAEREHHDHMYCVKCNSIEEFRDDAIEVRQKKIAAKARFHMTDHNLTLYGICRKCDKSNS